MTNNKIKKTAQKMCNEFKNSNNDNTLATALSDDFQNVLNIAKAASRNWKEMSVKLVEYLRDIQEYFDTQFKGQEDRLSLEYRTTHDTPEAVKVIFRFHNNKSLIRTVLCPDLF